MCDNGLRLPSTSIKQIVAPLPSTPHNSSRRVQLVPCFFTSYFQAFSEVVTSHGASPDLSYNIALCHFRQKQYAAALKMAADIIAQGVREHPELGVGSTTGGVSVRSVGNSQLLRSTALVEAFNLKAAVELALGNTAAAREALTDMPPRKQEELDQVAERHTLG